MGCKQCNKKVSDSDRIVCRGFCESTFHMICVKVDVPALDVMGTHPNNFFWMCDECSKLFLSSHFRHLVKENGAGPKALVESMKTVQSDIAKLASTVAALNEKVEAQSTSSSDWPTLGQKRQRDSSADPPGKANIPAASRGKKAMTSVLIIADAEPDDLWYIWLSSFPPTVTEDDICTMVKECLSVDEDDPVVVKMLVKKGVDVAELSSITFKVGVSRDYRDSSLDADNWPAGLAFREFIDFTRRPSVATSGFAKRRTD
ncbi:uncharacterized protein LOC120430365 [Culex pipiens pallens]|uniref:uncharacterized protein LOC120430365 n=1 Tax=Culex pipiens pallens TaxID=42434 RepID=UPI0019549AE5|nr:uncharacterized protein LOC120430365 [Culex pipiens pallens]